MAIRLGVNPNGKDPREARRKEADAKDLSFLDAIVGVGPEPGVYTTPGDGMIDYVATFHELRGYSGWSIVEAEQDPEKAPTLSYVRKGVAHPRAALRESGLD